jgi:hypothetical protein
MRNQKALAKARAYAIFRADSLIEAAANAAFCNH